MDPGSIVILNLVQPTEKFWGVLQRLAPEGITLRGINLSSFDDWVPCMSKLAKGKMRARKSTYTQ